MVTRYLFRLVIFSHEIIKQYGVVPGMTGYAQYPDNLAPQPATWRKGRVDSLPSVTGCLSASDAALTMMLLALFMHFLLASFQQRQPLPVAALCAVIIVYSVPDAVV